VPSFGQTGQTLGNKMGTKDALLHLLLLIAVAKGSVEKLRCPSRVERFSSKLSSGHFYECNAERYPVLMECPSGKLYHMQKQKCLSKEETPKNQAIVEKSMGRSMDLGTLYDAKKSQVYSDASLWSQKTIEENKFQYDRKEVNTAFTADKSVHDKTSHFDISARLSMEFMGGMVSVEGAMSYLDDEVSSEREVNVEMLYHTTKYTETLPKKTPKDHAEECGNVNDPYTHVVTSVTYGLDCNFVFKYMLASHETESSITGELGIAINNIPSFSISGKGSVNLTESEQSMMSNTHLNMYGDFTLDSSSNLTLPTDFESACRFFGGLPHLASTQATILEVHMTPIEDICDAEDYLLNEIADSMMAEVINMLDELNQLEIKASGLMITPEAVKFPALKKNLNTYKIALTNFIYEKQAQLQDLLPKIRAGEDAAEEDLITLLDDYTNSPYEFETSNAFLIDRNREIYAISFLLSSFPDDAENIAVVDYQAGTDVGFILNHKYVIMVDFNILTPPSLTDDFLDGNTQTEENFWYNSIPVNGHVGSLLRNFSDFALENAGLSTSDYGYMINCKVIKEGEEDPTTMTALKEGQPISTHFVVPSAPLQPYIQDISYDHFKFSVPRFNEFTTGLKVIITNVYEEFDYDQTITWSNTEDEVLEIVIDSRVDPATVYSVVAQYTTEVGLGPKSVSSRLFITAPSSPPENLAISDVTTNSLRVSWDKPTYIGNGISEDELIYNIELTGEDGYVERKTAAQSEHEFIFEDLVDATKYNIEAKTYLEEGESAFTNETIDSLIFLSVSQPASIYQNSNPFSPKMIPSMPGEVTTSSAMLRWEPPAHLPAFDTLTYKLVYWPTEFEEDEVEVTVEDVHYELTDLPMATMYAAKVKLETNLGESEFSGVLTVKTLDEDSEVGHFGDEIKDNLNEIVEDMRKRSSFCASSAQTNVDGVLTYDKLFLEQSNVPGASLDIGSGKFVAGSTGSYQVMVSAEVVTAPGQGHNIWVAVNDVKKEESLIHSESADYLFGSGFDNASKDIVLRLNAGDTVSITHTTTPSDGKEQLLNVIFCVSSIKLY